MMTNHRTNDNVVEIMHIALEVNIFYRSEYPDRLSHIDPKSDSGLISWFNIIQWREHIDNMDPFVRA